VHSTADRSGTVDRRLFSKPVFRSLPTRPAGVGAPGAEREGESRGTAKGSFQLESAAAERAFLSSVARGGAGRWRRARGGCRDGGNAPVEPFDDQSQAGEQPDRQQAVALVVADMLEAVAVLGVVEAWFSISHRLLAIWKRVRLLTQGEESR